MENNDSSPKKKPVHSNIGVRMSIIVVLALAIGAALYMKGQNAPSVEAESASSAPEPAAPSTSTTGPVQSTDAAKTTLPKLVDLGAGKCIPCKMMAPILEELKKTYAGKLDVVFIDVWEKPDEAKSYNINLIPTQIFYDASGKERFRHEGFFSKEDILAKWKELGVEL